MYLLSMSLWPSADYWTNKKRPTKTVSYDENMHLYRPLTVQISLHDADF